ncbi:MAG: hypothetical protein K0Q49_441 [Haloplasmataceae bacterium]|jgi:glycine dehydrogenase subunit 1|nr:hypothetical protein [Haloplasmataceae bacterium]
MNHKYIPHTESNIKEMLEKIGISHVSDLFKEIPEEVKLKRNYNLTRSLSELEVTKIIRELGSVNYGTDDLICFLGAGSYDHYIPSTVNHITSRNEFYTAYTPYQPEVAQGTLQYIFEYQTMITDLTGYDVSNASMYDGATSCAEAMMMTVSQTKKNKVLVASLVHPHTIAVLQTYAHFRNVEIVIINEKNGLLDLADLETKLDQDVASLIVSNPNFYGNIDDYSQAVTLIHNNKSLLVMVVNPLSLPLIKTPGEIGADIACGDGQPLGMSLSFGGPYLGFLTTNKMLMRKMPGRICGQTKDVDGKRAFVLTLQAREQHIRREKANSNICSNQSLNALAATVYMSTLGKQGMKEVAIQNVKKANYALNKICTLPHFSKVYEAPIFNEFVVKSNVSYDVVKEALLKANMMCGLHLGDYNELLKDHILFCVTEKRTKAEIDQLVAVLGGLK